MGEVTLLFRHLPAELTSEEKKDLLQYIGASRIKVMGKAGPMKNTAFAVFRSEEEAWKIVHQLHQTEFLGSRLVVEFAKTEQPDSTAVFVHKEGFPKPGEYADNESNGQKNNIIIPQKKEPREIKFDTTFGIWGLKHTRHPEYRYTYPPLTQTILTNISNALAAVPRFYVQVLHLMNKMDLPAPFGPVTTSPPVQPDAGYIPLPDDIDQQEMEISSESESELESSEEEDEKKKRIKNLDSKRSSQLHLKRQNIKRPRLSDLQEITHPVLSAATTVQVSEIFEEAVESFSGTKKIEMKLPSHVTPAHALGHAEDSHFSGTCHMPNTNNVPDKAQKSVNVHAHAHAQQYQLPALSTFYQQHQQAYLLPSSSFTESNTRSNTDQKIDEVESPVHSSSELHPESELSNAVGFGILLPVQKEQENKQKETIMKKEWSRLEFISQSELKKSSLSSSEMRKMSVFKNYSEGEPSCRLYIKNLAKNVTEEDLHWIYGRYVDWENESETRIFDIKLMKEGRMKGQAFVHLPTEKCAQTALKDTNGFILNEKPMVVQFARSAKMKE